MTKTNLLESFIEQHKDKKIVAVQGLGFVGAVMSVVVANAENDNYAVIGVDLPTDAGKQKIEAINNGVFPLQADDPLIETFFQNTQKKKNFCATEDPKAFGMADIIVVDINLDVKKHVNDDYNIHAFDVKMEGFKKGIENIAMYCKADVLLLIETTVPPGTCENIVEPIMAKAFAKRNLKPNYKIAHSYERVMPGPNYINSIQNFYRVYSGMNDEAADAAQIFLENIINTKEYPLTRLANTNASEIGKVLENSFRAMNIAFIDEWTKFAEAAGVNLFEIIDAIRKRPTHRNIMKPGLGVGGYCLPKDPLLASWASQTMFNGPKLEQSENAVQVNDKMPLHTLQVIENVLDKVAGSHITVLGVSYLANVGDTRYTPLTAVYKGLKKKGANIILHDPFLIRWVEEGVDVISELDAALAFDSEVLLLSTAHKVYKESKILLQKIIDGKFRIVIDANNVFSEAQIELIKSHTELIIIGRGDIKNN